MNTIFKLPDLGEGLPDAEIHEWHVKVGDEVKVDQLLVSMETAKAVVEVPSPCTGRIVKFFGNPGDVINTGQPLVEFSDNEAIAEVEPAPSSAATVAGSIEVGNTVIHEAAHGIDASQGNSQRPETLPVIRVIAQKLGLDLTQIPASGRAGEITIDDLCRSIKQFISTTSQSSTRPHSDDDDIDPSRRVLQPGASEGGEGVYTEYMTDAERTCNNAAESLLRGIKPVKGVRKAMALSMAQSHASVVPVTLSDLADLSAWEAGADFSVRLIRALCAACKAEPVMNAYFDGQGFQIDIKSAVHLGLAVDSPDGLFVPVIKNADSLSSDELRVIINRFKEQVKNRSIPQDDLRGATITLSNFGVFAGYFANPVVVPPMVTIVGAGRSRDEAVPVNGKIEIHRILPLSVTFDHRAATGGEASRFLKAMIDDLAKEY